MLCICGEQNIYSRNPKSSNARGKVGRYKLVLSAEQIEEAIIRNLKHPPVEALNRGGDVDVELVDSCSTLPHKAKLVKKKRLDSGSVSEGVYYVLHIVDKIEMKPGQVMKLQYHGGAIFFFLV